MMQMATTLTFAVLRSDATVLIGHVGDSRADIGDGAGFMQVTNDHTVAMDKVRAAELSLHDAERDPGWHVLSNWIGWEPYRLETWELHVEPGDRLLPCSDGLIEHDRRRQDRRTALLRHATSRVAQTGRRGE